VAAVEHPSKEAEECSGRTETLVAVGWWMVRQRQQHSAPRRLEATGVVFRVLRNHSAKSYFMTEYYFDMPSAYLYPPRLLYELMGRAESAFEDGDINGTTS
jgi:hypothetical protein